MMVLGGLFSALPAIFMPGNGAFGGAMGTFVGGLPVAKTGNCFPAIRMVALAGIAGLVCIFFQKAKRKSRVARSQKG